MSGNLASAVRRELARPVVESIAAFACRLAEQRGVVAVLFYGSILRTGDLDGVLDYYLLTDGDVRHGSASPVIWPEVSYHEGDFGGRRLRAKAATMRLDKFHRAAAGRTIDTTIWTRFVQPAALVWTADAGVEGRVIAAVGAACRTASRFAAALGPDTGTARDYWRALFRRTYAAELRFEQRGRADQIVEHDPERYDRLLPLCWREDDIAFEQDGEILLPHLPAVERRHLQATWRLRQLAGKPLNAVRLIKAAFTFEGAGRYGAWKVERHTGVPVALTPFREKHPILAAPGVLWHVWRARKR